MNENSTPLTEKPQRRAGAALGGLMLIVLGTTFLLQRLGLLGSHFNWWALFILIPAFGALGTAWMAFTRGGLNAAARGSLGGGLIILTVALMFLLGLNWALWWPLMVIVPGLAIGLNGFSETPNAEHQAWAHLNWWIGAAVAGLGGLFLLHTLQMINLRALFGTFQWWGFFILVPGVGAVVHAGEAFWHNGRRLTGAVRGLLLAGVAFLAVAGVALLGLAWNLLVPIILIASGLVLLASLGARPTQAS